MELVFVLGRLIFGGYFAYNGINHFRHLKMLAGYSQMKGVPLPTVAVFFTGLLLFLGGLSFIFDYYAMYGSIMLIVFLVPTSFMMHNFWKINDAQQKMVEQINFTKNLALLGAVLMFLKFFS